MSDEKPQMKGEAIAEAGQKIEQLQAELHWLDVYTNDVYLHNVTFRAVASAAGDYPSGIAALKRLGAIVTGDRYEYIAQCMQAIKGEIIAQRQIILAELEKA